MTNEGTAIVVTYNSGRTVERTLATLATATAGMDWRILVVDNASTDDTLARAVHARAEMVANPHNRGLAAANNQGLRAATGDWALLCNPDIELRPEAVRELLACARRHPRAAFIVPKLTHPDGSLQVSAGSLPTLHQALLGHRWSLARRGDLLSDQIWWEGWAHDIEMRIGHGAESCYLARRAAIEQIGLQDERFWLDWEGVDWARRAQSAGWETWFTPDAVVVHEGGASISRAKVRWILATHRSMYRYFSTAVPLTVRPALAILVAGRAAVKVAANWMRFEVYRRSSAGSR